MTCFTSVRNRPACRANSVAAFSALAVLLLIAGFAGPALAGPGPSTPVLDFHGIRWEIVPHPACPDSVTRVRFHACRCNVALKDGELVNGLVVLHATVQPFLVCVPCDPDSLDVPIGQLAAGSYNQAIQIVADVVDSLNQVHTETGNFSVPFVVAPTCQSFPGSILPFLNAVIIGRGAPCDICPQIACAGDSIPVILAGILPSNCTRVDEVRLVTSPIVGPEPEPEMIQIYYKSIACTGTPCDRLLHPWQAGVKLSPLLARPYGLIIETFLSDVCTARPPVLIGETSLPFVVQGCDSLPPPPGACFDARFAQREGGVCDDFLGSDGTAQDDFQVANTVSLAGLQGTFRFDLPGLTVTKITPEGPAAGLRLFWNPEPDGAKFVLYSDNGQLIPAQPPVPPEQWQSILHLDLALAATKLPGPVPGQIRLHPQDVLASDSVGQAVPVCFLPTVIRDLDATICLQRAGCDVNHDGVTDVRDLVIMAMCITGTGACPDTTGGALDCDGNGVVDLSDVMCCALHILDQEPIAGGNQGVDDSHIAVQMGMPQPSAVGDDVPLALYGTSRLGAARLDLTFPSDRYDLASVDLPAAPGWLSLSQKGAGHVALAWIAAGSAASQTDVQNAVLHLVRKPGMSDGGDLTVSASQFASPSGGAVRASAAGVSLSLAGGRVAMSSPLPNPAGGRTSFSVTLAQSGALDIGVFDAGGRRIATVFHGDAQAGVRTFTWDGRRDSGVAAGSGLFFLRAESSGFRVTSKVMLLSPR
jgi:hypothetical protein